MKKILSFLLCTAIIFALAFSADCASVSRKYVTNAKTPVSVGKLKFQKKLGDGFKNSPTPPIVCGDTIITVSGGVLYKISCENGEVLSSAKTCGKSTYSVVPPLCQNGMIFCRLDDGIIRAFDFKTLKSLWIFKDKLGGRALSSITFEDGKIYTGFWNGETADANFVCIETKDENKSRTDESKKALWTYKSKGGFYWASAIITKNFVVVGCDNGVRDSVSKSSIVSLKKTNGKKFGSLSVDGDIRSGISYDAGTKRFFCSSKAGFVYSFALDGTSGKFSSKKTFKAPGAVTATPVFCGGRLYFGCSDGASGGKFVVLDAKTLKKIFDVSLDGYPRASALLSTGNKNVCAYFTVNKAPGSLYLLEDKGDVGAVKTIYTPQGNSARFSISEVVCSDDGTLFYKNDSGTIFAVSPRHNFLVELLNSLFERLKLILNL